MMITKKKIIQFSLICTACAGILVSVSPLSLPATTQVVSAASSKADQSTDVTSKLQLVGQPFSTPAYARNVWDMQVFDGKIYLGHGNSSNAEPSPNAGPIPIVYYNPQTSQFVTEKVTYTDPKTGKQSTEDATSEEQIDTFKILKGKLYIPGNDSKSEQWSFGNFYKLDGGQWNKYRNLPDGIHVYDMAYYHGKLLAAIGTDTAPKVLISDDNGENWKELAQIKGLGTRAYKFFEFKGTLYAAAILMPNNNIWGDQTHLLAIDKKFNVTQQQVSGTNLLPGMTYVQTAGKTPYMKMGKTVVFRKQLAYIVGDVYNDAQLAPKALIVTKNIADPARTVTFPDTHALPTDIITRPNKTYVLTYTKQADGSYINRVYMTKNLTKWTQILQFDQDTYAKSFEELNGDFYFGLGTDTKPVSESAGKILKVKASDLKGKS